VKEILLVRQGGLGDLLAVLPSLRFLRAAFPECRLTIVCRQGYGLLFRSTGLVDGLESESGSRFARLFLEPGSNDAETAAWLRGYDLVLGWTQGEASRALEPAVRSYGVPCRVIAYDPGQGLSVSRYFYEHTARRFADRMTSVFSFEDGIFLPITADIRHAGRALAGEAGISDGARYAVIHPGAGSLKKRWPLKNFLTVATRLSREGLPGLLITGEAEAEVEKVIKTAALPRSWTWLSRPDIMSLAGLLAESFLYLGNDSGITHLAAACGTKVLAVFRTEFESAWKPNGRVLMFSAEEVTSIPVESVETAACRESGSA
jgi:ADP-heptose:LPS heptosyltransferase